MGFGKFGKVITQLNLGSTGSTFSVRVKSMVPEPLHGREKTLAEVVSRVCYGKTDALVGMEPCFDGL